LQFFTTIAEMKAINMVWCGGSIVVVWCSSISM